MISCRDVGKVLSGHRVLDGVSVDVERGAVLGVVGPNGAGKSTLVRVLAGETSADTGSVTIEGREVAALREGELARMRAMLPQQVEIVFDFTVRELVLLGRTPHEPLETAASRAMAERCIELAGLGDRGDVPVAALSGGERQRAHFARVLAQIGLGESGTYLLLDEPASNQDPAWQLRMLDEVRALAIEARVGVLVVLHDLNLAARSCDQILLMRRGACVRCGPSRDVMTKAILETVFEVEAHVESDPWDAAIPRVTFRRPSC